MFVSSLQKGTKAPQAAGRIHTDFEKGFIMAEVFKFNDLKEEGSEAAVKVILQRSSSIFLLVITFISLIGRRKVSTTRQTLRRRGWRYYLVQI